MAVIPRQPRTYSSPSLLDRALDLSRVNLEIAAYVGLVLLSIIAHLWALDRMAMHHDESIHAWMSWKFFTGVGGFVCAGGRTAVSYCYDPVYHGPSLYVMTLISYFLFGDGEAQARLPQALCGVLMVASTWMLRPYLGRRGAFVAAVLLAFAPSLLYYTRFARHDGLMVLWTFWMVVGFFRYLDTGRARFLYLLAASTALSIATHELYYILFFLFGFFVLVRLLSELVPRRSVTIWLGVIFAVALVLEILNPQISGSLRAGGIALLFTTVSGVGLLLLRVWDNTPVLVPRAKALWNDDRGTLWIALGILGAIYVLLYGVFFTDPRGILDGLYRGISYWLGSQHEFARGKQPWYYYLMLLPIYEPLALLGSLGAGVFLFTRRTAPDNRALEAASEENVTANNLPLDDGAAERRATTDDLALDERRATPAGADQAGAVLLADDRSLVSRMFPLFLAFWFLGALVAFSWAGEKMPWLLVHIALPGNLLAAWAIGRVLDRTHWRALPDRSWALVPPMVLLLVVVLGVALWRFSPSGAEGIQAQVAMLQGIVPLLVAGLLIFGLLTVAQRLGTRATLALCSLTIAGLVGAYMIRATWMVVYDHPDTPREILIYTQSTPEVPLIVRELEELAINQTRNNRSASDPVGGNSMPVIMDIGDTNGDGSLAWPYQWYFRNFQRLENRNAEFFREATANSFDVQVPGSADGVVAPAPAVLVYAPHVTTSTANALEQNYVKRYDSKLNWWFPEGDLTGCDPSKPGYKQFYYSTLSIDAAKADSSCGGIDFNTAQYQSPLAPLLWPLEREHWPDTWRFLLWRELPQPLRLDGREMQVWIRKDLATGSAGGTTGATAGGGASSTIKLVSQEEFGVAGSGPGQLTDPRGVAVDAQGNVYVADTGNHRIEVFSPDGTPLRSFGSFGSGEAQFNEPRGVAVDAQGNIYVADTWNARVVKLDAQGNQLATWGTGRQDLGSGRVATMTDGTQAGNAADPLGLFGPRGVAVDSQGYVYIADTGNKRIVVTDGEGNFRSQWGYEGSAPGAFNEPLGVAVDDQGNVYVADTWNGRVQMFAGSEGQVNPAPIATWSVPGWQANTYDDPYIAAAGAGQVYVSVPSQDALLYMSSTGSTLLNWGGTGTDAASVTLPSGLASGPDGGVYVVDRGNNRVLLFTLPRIAAP